MRPLVRPAAVLGILLALLPAVLAHPGDEYEALSAEKDGVTVYVTPQTLVVKAQRDVILLGEGYSATQQRYAPIMNATWALDATGPGEASFTTQPYGYGFGARANFSARGSWTLRVTVNGTTVDLPLDVYPPTGVRAEASTLRYNLHYVNHPVKASVYFVDDATEGLVKKDATVTARVERWVNETRPDEEVVPLKPGSSTGEFTFEHTFKEEGTYRVRLASPEHGIGYAGLPPFKVNVLPARLAEERSSRATRPAPARRSPRSSSSDWPSRAGGDAPRVAGGPRVEPPDCFKSRRAASWALMRNCTAQGPPPGD